MRIWIALQFLGNNDHFNLQYLSSAEGVSKMALGDYLGGAGDFSVEVLKAFTALQDFTNKGVLEVYLYFAIW
jgi:hypothetical protein